MGCHVTDPHLWCLYKYNRDHKPCIALYLQLYAPSLYKADIKPSLCHFLFRKLRKGITGQNNLHWKNITSKTTSHWWFDSYRLSWEQSLNVSEYTAAKFTPCTRTEKRKMLPVSVNCYFVVGMPLVFAFEMSCCWSTRAALISLLLSLFALSKTLLHRHRQEICVCSTP